VRQHRGDHNRFGIAVLMAYLRCPGRTVAKDEKPHDPVLNLIAEQLQDFRTVPDISRFRNCPAFASWLGVRPEKQVIRGKVLFTRTRKVKNRPAIALQLGAHCLYHAQIYLVSSIEK
jgi:hypothetical protein